MVTWWAECLQSSEALSHATSVAEHLPDRHQFVLLPMPFSANSFVAVPGDMLEGYPAELTTLLTPLVPVSVDLELSWVAMLQCLGQKLCTALHALNHTFYLHPLQPEMQVPFPVPCSAW